MNFRIKKPAKIIGCLILTALMVFFLPRDSRQSQNSKPVLETPSRTTNHENNFNQKLRLTDAEKTWLKAHPDIELGYTDAFEPEVIVNPDGSHRGILVDFLGELNERLGTSIRLRIDPIPELLKKTQKKEVDGILSLTPGYADKLGLLKTRSHFTNYPVIFAYKGVSFEHPSNLAHKRVAIIDKVFFSEKIVEQFGDGTTILKVKDALEGLQRVEQGKADFFIGASLNTYLITKYQLFDLATQYVFYDYPINAVIATRSDWPELSAILDKGISSFSKNEIDAITAKWIHLPQRKEVIALTDEERAWLTEHPEIRFAFSVDYPPALILDEDGRLSGMLKDVLDLLNQRLGTDFSITVAEINAVREMVANKKVAGQLALTEGNGADRGLLETRGLWEIYPIIYGPRNSPLKIKGLEDLKGKTVSTLKGAQYAEKILESYLDTINIVRTDSIPEALMLLYEGRVDYMIGLTSNVYYIAKMRLRTLRPVFVMTNHPEKVVMGVRDDWPELVEILDKGLKSITEDEWAAIDMKWLGISDGIPSPVSLTPEEKDWLEQKQTVRVRIADWPPYMIVRDDQSPQGIAIDYLNLIGERTGINFKYEVTNQPFAEFLESMKQRQGPDMAPIIVQTPDREQYLSFTEPYISSPYVIFAREQNDLILDMGDLAGKTLAVPRGFIVQRLVARDFPKIRLALFDSDEQALDAVATGRADAYIGNLTVAGHLIQRRGFSDLRVVAPTPFDEQSLSMGSRSDWPELASIINKALASITEDEKTAIHNKYVALRYEQGINRATLLKWVLVVVGTASGIVLLFVFWNRSLAKQVHERTSKLEITNISLETEIDERKQAEKKILEYQQRLKALASQLTVTEEKERRRIAADLHDHIGQSLALARIQMAAAKKSAANDGLAAKLDDISEILREAVQDTRHLIFDLSPPAMHEIGLGAAISEWLDDQIGNRYGLKTEFFDNIDQSYRKTLDESVRAILFRNVRELLINVVKHSQANQVNVSMEVTDDVMKIVVQDDGVGFDYSPEFQTVIPKGGFGLFSVKERMSDLGGALEIESEPGKGCTAIISVPLDSGLK